MSGESVDQLREQLRDRGYLTHGIERWFALDPWRSRTFWVELAIVATKAAVIVAIFGSLPEVTIMVTRNHPLGVTETLLLLFLYAASWLVGSFLFIMAVGLLLKIRPEVVIDTPRTLLAISLAVAAAFVLAVAFWWARFETPPSLLELAVGLALVVLFFLVATVVVSAALLTFSVYELRRIPAIHSRSRTVPMTVSAAIVIAILLLSARTAQEKGAPAVPIQVVTMPTQHHVAFLAVDGLTLEIWRTRPELGNLFPLVSAAPPVAGGSTAERWATVGTGVPTAIHGVRAIEGVRLAGGAHVIQSISKADFVLRKLGAVAALARRQPLPPTARKRDFVWEIVAARGVPSVAVDWWTSTTGHSGALDSIGQESLFATAKGDAVRVDAAAARRFESSLQREKPQLATVYLPALDVVLNRLPLDTSTRLSASIRALDGIAAVASVARGAGYDLLLVGLPGDGQRGSAVIASTIPLPPHPSPVDLAPTLLGYLGFPVSDEMPGRNAEADAARIASYGVRNAPASSARVDQEYYENLKSLGYIK